MFFLETTQDFLGKEDPTMEKHVIEHELPGILNLILQAPDPIIEHPGSAAMAPPGVTASTAGHRVRNIVIAEAVAGHIFVSRAQPRATGIIGTCKRTKALAILVAGMIRAGEHQAVQTAQAHQRHDRCPAA